MKKQILVLALVVSLLMSVVLPKFAGHVSAAPQVHTQQTASHVQAFDKTRFLLHVGFAFFALHHWVYKPFTQHKLGRFHIINDLKAGLALLFAYHEIKVAYGIAKGSKSKTLHLITAPLNALGSAFNAIGSKLRHGDTSGVSALATQAGSLQTLAGKNGFSIVDKAIKITGVG
jgi:hypothetical protein